MSYECPMRDKYVPEWQAILRENGWPTDVLVIDFENYFDDDYSMRKDDCSTIQYIMDERFENLGVSTLLMNQPFKQYRDETQWWNGEAGVAQALALYGDEYGWDNLTVVAQNARYDLSILAYRFGITPAYTIDILGLARHWNARARNDLDTLTQRHNLPAKGDTSKFKGLTNRPRWFSPKKKRGDKTPPLPMQRPKMTPMERAKLAEYANNDVMREWELFTLLLPKLSRPKTELRLIHETIRLFTNPVLHVDAAKGAELIAGMQSKIDEAVGASGLTPKQIRGRHFDDTVYGWLKEHGPTPCGSADAYTKEAKCRQGWKLATSATDWQREELLKHPDERVRNAMQAKLALHSWPNHIKRVGRIVGQAHATPTKALPVPLKYNGAHTGRWAGDEKINLQNLGERNPEPLIRGVRELLGAPPGYKLVIADLSAIEGRGTGWIAGQEDLMQQFRDQDADPEATVDVYTKFASQVLGSHVRKPNKDGGIPAVEKQMKWARNAIGKVGVLGCGYGMGPAKAEAFAGGAIDFEMAEKIVKTYRQANAKITQFWKDIEKSFIYTFKQKRECSLPRGLHFRPGTDADVILTLPTGREQTYHDVRVKPGTYGPQISMFNPREKNWGHLWGGHLTENVVQAFCRDILADAWLRCIDRGVCVVLHVHDELVAVAKANEAEHILDVMIEELTRPLEWGPDFPLAAEGVITERYGGH